MQSATGGADSSSDQEVLVLAPSVVAPYLDYYGYAAVDANTWRVAPSLEITGGPRFEVSVAGHEEVSKHTWYTLSCSVVQGGAVRTEWKIQRRLLQLRKDLHNNVKQELGQAYDRHFSGAHFAYKGGVRGTTARLQGWCSALTACINAGHIKPSVVALVFQLLEAPDVQLCRDTTSEARSNDTPVDHSDIEIMLDIGGDEPMTKICVDSRKSPNLIVA